MALWIIAIVLIGPPIVHTLVSELILLGKYGSLLLLIAGTVLYAKFMLDRALDRAKSKKS